MRTVSMSGSERPNVGKKDAAQLRSEGLVPCVIYGGKEQICIAIPETQFKSVIYTPKVCFIEITVGKNKYLTMLQDIQYHKVKEHILHADFFELKDSRKIVMAVPVTYKGSSPGVLKGGKLVKMLRKLKIQSFPKDMPEYIEIDLSKLDIGDMVKVNQMESKNFVFVENSATTVCIVRTTRNVVADAPAGK
jgi:large subunit ribosomal protein L25